MSIDHCHQVSCRFDSTLLQSETAHQLGIVLPENINTAVQKRKAEFIAGRYCAHKALRQLCVKLAVMNDCNSDSSLLVGTGENRQPVWPPGFTGSITHTHGYASAMVAPCNEVRALGLDAEHWIAPATIDAVYQQILTPGEDYTAHRKQFGSLVQYLTFVFSAKESLFKCLFPLVQQYFDFRDAVITPLSPDPKQRGRFRFELLTSLNNEFCAGFSGHGTYAVDDAGVHTAVIIEI